MDLGWNDLTGPVPASFGGLTSLEALGLSGNWGLTGTLPREAFCNCRSRGWTSSSPNSVRRSLGGRRIWIGFDGQLCGVVDVRVDVAVVYTPAAREAAGGVSEISALVDLMVAEANQAYVASGARHRIALVSLSEMAYTEAENSREDLIRLATARRRLHGRGPRAAGQSRG